MFKAKYLLASAFLVNVLHAQVEEVLIQWIPMLCLDSCVQGLYQEFAKIPGLANVSINQSQGQAILQYGPRTLYSYQPINTAMAMIGLSINHIKAQVSGTISHSERDIFLTSTGDGTLFTLISPLRPVQNGYAVPYDYNLYAGGNRPLSEDMRQQLLQAEQAGQELTISGPLFVPERSPPNYLVVESVRPTPQRKRNGQ